MKKGIISLILGLLLISTPLCVPFIIFGIYSLYKNNKKKNKSVDLLAGLHFSDSEIKELNEEKKGYQTQQMNLIKNEDKDKTVKIILCQKSDHSEREKKSYQEGIKYAVQSFMQMGDPDVTSGKEWSTGGVNPCEVCIENQKAGSIPVKDKFPSGHLYPPAGPGCRCCLLPTVKKDDSPVDNSLLDKYGVKVIVE